LLQQSQASIVLCQNRTLHRHIAVQELLRRHVTIAAVTNPKEFIHYESAVRLNLNENVTFEIFM